MIAVTDQFEPVTVIIRSSGLARYVCFEMSVESLNVPLSTSVARAISSNLVGTLNGIVRGSHTRYVWIIDDDHQFDTHTLLRLVAHDKPVIVPLVCMSRPPFESVIFKSEVEAGEEIVPADLDDVADDINRYVRTGTDASHEYIRDRILGLLRARQYRPKNTRYYNFGWSELDVLSGLLDVHAAGLAGMLIRRDVFDAIEPPWFTLGQTNPEEVGDDVGFCAKARAVGFAITCDLDLVIGHVAPVAVWPLRLPNGTWTHRLYWENGQNIIVNRPDRPDMAPKRPQLPLRSFVDDTIDAAPPVTHDIPSLTLDAESERLVERARELQATGLKDDEAFRRALEETQV